MAIPTSWRGAGQGCASKDGIKTNLEYTGQALLVVKDVADDGRNGSDLSLSGGGHDVLVEGESGHATSFASLANEIAVEKAAVAIE